MFQNLGLNILGGKNLFVLYLIISSNFLANLFGCKVQQAFQSNMLLKHLLGILTMFFFVSIAESSNDLSSEPNKRFQFAIIIYLLFVISSRVKIHFWYPMIISLGILYVIQVYKDYESKQEKPSTEKINNYLLYQKIALGFSITMLIVGFLYYLYEKKLEYGEEFNLIDFFIGKTDCKGMLSESGPIETGDLNTELSSSVTDSNVQTGGKTLELLNDKLTSNNIHEYLEYEPADRINNYFD